MPDPAWRHKASARQHSLHFPLLADFEPKGAIARAYGACHQVDGLCERALIVIDKHGVIAWSYCFPMAINAGADGILAALKQPLAQETCND